MKKIVISIAVAYALLVSAGISNAQPNFKKCDELKGAAWGLCKAAIAHG